MSATLSLAEKYPRVADHDVDRLFVDRWSKRAFTGDAVPHADLLVAFEAARWAPSSLNYQPWRFIYAHRDSARFADFIALLGERNRLWAVKAGVIVFFVSDTRITYGDKVQPSPSHAFDTGAAWANFAHQAHLQGYATRAIGGFDRASAPEALGLPEGFTVHVAVAIGVPDAPSTLPDVYRDKEFPSNRRPLTDLIFDGHFTPTTESLSS